MRPITVFLHHLQPHQSSDELDLIWDVVLPTVYDEAGGLGSPGACKEKAVSKEMVMTGMYFKLGKELRI